MKRLIHRAIIFISGQQSGETGYVVQNSVRLFILYGCSVGLSFLLNYVLIKMAGVPDYGAYVYFFNLINLLVGFCLLGVDTLLVKNISIYESAGSYDKLKGILVFSLLVVFTCSVVVGLISDRGGFLTGDDKKYQQINWCLLGFFALLLLSLSAVSQAALQGLKKIIISQFTEKLIRPAFLILTVIILFYYKKLTLTDLVWSNLLAISVGFLITLFFLYRNIGLKIKSVKPSYEPGNWSRSTARFFMIGVLYMLNSRIDIFFLGFLKGDQQVGVYNIVLKVSELISFALMIMNFVLAPLIAPLFANGNLVLLQKMVTRSAQMIMAAGLPAVAVIAIFRDDILRLFGVNFMGASGALLILSLGQFMNIFCGSAGMLLMMSGNEKFSILSLGISTLFNIALNITLIPIYGIIGAAMATAGSLIIWNLLMYFFVRKKLNLRTTAIGII